MRKLKLQVQMTVDGFIGGPNGELDWMTMPWTEDVNTYVDELLQNVDCMVLGRKLAENFIPYWKGVADDNNNPEQASGKMFTEIKKVVFTKSLQRMPWENTNTELSHAHVAHELERLKNMEGGDIYACGGAEFVSNLIRYNLVDEYHLFINPVAIGAGKPIFAKLQDRRVMVLVQTKVLDCGVVVLKYIPKRG